MALDFRAKLGLGVMGLITVVVCVLLIVQPPIAQSPSYHNFADNFSLFAIPNFWNVMSNAPFLIVGILGLYKLHGSQSLKVMVDIKWAYSLFFSGVVAVSLGSAYYHLAPSNQTLVWDRLPMTIAFMSLFAIILAEYISRLWGKWMLLPLLVLGLFSVIYWRMSELQGEGDLRLYLLVQFLPMLLMPIVLLCFKSAYSRSSGYWYLLLAYLAAKLFDHFDGQIFALAGGFVSGHTLKHVAAALGVYALIYAYEHRWVNDY